MTRMLGIVIIVAVLLFPVSAALAQATPTPTPKAKTTPPKTDSPKTPSSKPNPSKPPALTGDYAVGYVESVVGGSPTFVVLRLAGASESVRRLKVAGRLRVALTPEAMQNAAAILRQGELLRFTGVIRDGTFFATLVTLATSN